MIDRHMNYEFRYCVMNGLVTGERDVWFYPNQYYPSKRPCADGECTEDLCNISDDEFTTDVLEWSTHWEDPSPFEREVQKVMMDDERVVSFVMPEKKRTSNMMRNRELT